MGWNGNEKNDSRTPLISTVSKTTYITHAVWNTATLTDSVRRRVRSVASDELSTSVLLQSGHYRRTDGQTDRQGRDLTQYRVAFAGGELL